MTRTPAEVAAVALTMPCRDFANPGGELDMLRRREAMRAALSALEREGYVVVRAVEQEAGIANLREAWSALAMIREAVETLGPVGAMPAREHQSGPTFMDEAEAIVAGVRKMADGGWQLMGSAPKDGRRLLLWQNSDRGAFEGWWHESIVCNEAYWTDDADTEPQPKFWQPLPARPQDGGGA